MREKDKNLAEQQIQQYYLAQAGRSDAAQREAA